MWYKIGITLLRLVFLFFNPIRAKGRENLPAGSAILCPNHTTMKDPIYVAVAAWYRHPTHFMAKEELTKFAPLRLLFKILPVFTVKRNSGDISAVKNSIQVLRQGKKLVIFPEGTRIRDGQQADYKAGAAMLSAKTGAPLVPVYIRGGQPFFRMVTVEFGKPFHVEVTDKQHAGEAYHRAAQRLMEEVNALRDHQRM